MSNESMEVQLARVDERVNSVLKELEASRDSRRVQYEAMEALRLALEKYGNRIEAVEGKLANAQPTIEEFITIKHKVAGAGALGKWLWAVGGVLIGIAAGSREALLQWLSRGS